MWNWYPPVGFFIAILALLGVLVPLFRDLAKIGPREKAVWTAVMFVLVGLEFRSLYMDRADHDQKEAEARKMQLEGFQKIGDGINAGIKNSDTQFQTTMGQVEKTLKASERTLRNTQPFADLEFKGMNPFAPSFPIQVGKHVTFNVSFTNTGNENALGYSYFVRTYVLPPDNLESEKLIAQDFEKGFDYWWKHGNHQGGLPIEPGTPLSFSINTQNFDEREVRELTNHVSTIYAVIRFSYSDHTGHWTGDSCFLYQDITHDFDIAHICHFLNDHRYRSRY